MRTKNKRSIKARFMIMMLVGAALFALALPAQSGVHGLGGDKGPDMPTDSVEVPMQIAGAGTDDTVRQKYYMGGSFTPSCDDGLEEMFGSCLGGATFEDLPGGVYVVTIQDDTMDMVSAGHRIEHFGQGDEVCSGSFEVNVPDGGTLIIWITPPPYNPGENACGGTVPAFGTSGTIIISQQSDNEDVFIPPDLVGQTHNDLLDCAFETNPDILVEGDIDEVVAEVTACAIAHPGLNAFLGKYGTDVEQVLDQMGEEWETAVLEIAGRGQAMGQAESFEEWSAVVAASMESINEHLDLSPEMADKMTRDLELGYFNLFPDGYPWNCFIPPCPWEEDISRPIFGVAPTEPVGGTPPYEDAAWSLSGHDDDPWAGATFAAVYGASADYWSGDDDLLPASDVVSADVEGALDGAGIGWRLFGPVGAYYGAAVGAAASSIAYMIDN